MAGEPGVDQNQFGPFCLDGNGSPVFRDGADPRLRLQAVRVLKALLGRPGQSMDYEKLLKQAWGTTFVSRHTVATTVGEMRKTVEEYGSWIGYRLRVGYSLNIPRSDDQIRTGWHLSEPRNREGLGKTLACFQHTATTDPVRPPPTKAFFRMDLMQGMYGVRAPREMYKEFLEEQRDAIALSGRPSAVLCCSKRQ